MLPVDEYRDNPTSFQPISLEKLVVTLLVLRIAHDDPSFHRMLGFRPDVVQSLRNQNWV
jgi:hypothetical protein